MLLTDHCHPPNIHHSLLQRQIDHLSSLSTPPIVVLETTHLFPPIPFPLNRSTSVVVVNSTSKKVEKQIRVVYRSYHGIKINHYDSHDHTSIPARNRKISMELKPIKRNKNIYVAHL